MNDIRGLKAADVQADELWGFVQKKDRTKLAMNVEDETSGSFYTYVAMETNSKLILSCQTGRRDLDNTVTFIEKLLRGEHLFLGWDALIVTVT